MLCAKQGVKALKIQGKQEKHHCVQLRGVQIAVVFSVSASCERSAGVIVSSCSRITRIASMSLLIFSSSMTRCMVKRTTTRSIQSLRTAFYRSPSVALLRRICNNSAQRRYDSYRFRRPSCVHICRRTEMSLPARIPALRRCCDVRRFSFRFPCPALPDMRDPPHISSCGCAVPHRKVWQAYCRLHLEADMHRFLAIFALSIR